MDVRFSSPLVLRPLFSRTTVTMRIVARFLLHACVWVVFTLISIPPLVLLTEKYGDIIASFFVTLFVGIGFFVVGITSNVLESIASWVTRGGVAGFARYFVQGLLPATVAVLLLIQALGWLIGLLPLAIGPEDFARLTLLLVVLTLANSLPAILTTTEVALSRDNSTSLSDKWSENRESTPLTALGRALTSESLQDITLSEQLRMLLLAQEDDRLLVATSWDLARLSWDGYPNASELWSYLDESSLWQKRLYAIRMETNFLIAGLAGLDIADDGRIEPKWQRLFDDMGLVMRVHPKPSGYRIKTFLERIFAVAILIVGSPFMLWSAILLGLEIHSPQVLIKTARLTQGANAFNYIRFRVSRKGHLGPFGLFLLWSGFDRLPSLYNVLKGEMSIVGPRAVYPGTFVMSLRQTRNTELWGHYLSVKPGLLGPSQLSGYLRGGPYFRSEDYLAAGAVYAQKWSLISDIRLIAQSLKVFGTLLLPTAFKVQVGQQEIPPIGVTPPTVDRHSKKEEIGADQPLRDRDTTT